MKIKLASMAAATIAAACSSTPEAPPRAFEATPEPEPIFDDTQSSLPLQEQLVQMAGADRVFFDFDSFVVKPEAREVLRAHSDWLNQNPGVSVRIEGNCDERGTREYNLALGARRANAVRDYLVGLGVDPGRVTTISYGKDRPLDPNSNELAWATNRNARTYVLEDTLF